MFNFLFIEKVFEKEKIKSCLETIFEFNVMKYGDGKLGAVNGMRPNGQVDITSMQSEGDFFLRHVALFLWSN